MPELKNLKVGKVYQLASAILQPEITHIMQPYEYLKALYERPHKVIEIFDGPTGDRQVYFQTDPKDTLSGPPRPQKLVIFSTAVPQGNQTLFNIPASGGKRKTRKAKKSRKSKKTRKY